MKMATHWTPEQQAERAKIIAELWAQPGPKPLKPIPPDVMALVHEDETTHEEAERGYKELMENGGYSFEEVLAAFDRAAEEAQ